MTNIEWTKIVQIDKKTNIFYDNRENCYKGISGFNREYNYRVLDEQTVIASVTKYGFYEIYDNKLISYDYTNFIFIKNHFAKLLKEGEELYFSLILNNTFTDLNDSRDIFRRTNATPLVIVNRNNQEILYERMEEVNKKGMFYVERGLLKKHLVTTEEMFSNLLFLINQGEQEIDIQKTLGQRIFLIPKNNINLVKYKNSMKDIYEINSTAIYLYNL